MHARQVFFTAASLHLLLTLFIFFFILSISFPSWVVKVTTDDFDPSLQGCKTPYVLVLSREHLQQGPSNAGLF